MALPPVDVSFRVIGLADVLRAFKTIQQAAADTARAQAGLATASGGASGTYRKTGDEAAAAARKVRSSYDEAIKAAKELERANTAAAKSMKAWDGASAGRARTGTDAFGNTVNNAAADRGLRQISTSKAFEMVMGKTAAQLLGLHGPAGQLVGVFGLMKSAVGGAIDALTSFGSYLLNDVIKPQLKLSMTSAQVANIIGGKTTGAQVAGTINGLHETNANFDLATITKVFGSAAGKTKSLSQASEVSQLALMTGKAYNADPEKLAEYIGDQRAKFGHLNHENFAKFIAQDLTGAKNAGGDINAYLGSMRGLRNAGNAFGGASLDEQAGTQHYLGSLVAGASRDGKSGLIAANGLTQLIEDVKKRPEVFGMSHNQAMSMNASTFAESFLPHMISKVHGNLRDPRYGMGDQGGIAGTVPLNKTSVQFMQALGLDRIFNETKGSDADKEKAVADFVRGLTKAGNAADDLAKLHKDSANIDDTSAYKIAAAKARLESSMLKLLPPIEKVVDVFSKLVDNKSFGDAMSAALSGLIKALGMAAWGILSIAEMIPGLKGKIDPSMKKSIAKSAGLDFLTGDSETKATNKNENGVDDIDRKMFRASGSGATDLFNDLKIATGISSEDEVVGKNKTAARQADASKRFGDDIGTQGPAALGDFIAALKKAADAMNEQGGKDPVRFGAMAPAGAK